eukprot:5088165-Prymnesium_polylepis.1
MMCGPGGLAGNDGLVAAPRTWPRRETRGRGRVKREDGESTVQSAPHVRTYDTRYRTSTRLTTHTCSERSVSAGGTCDEERTVTLSSAVR